MFCKVIIIIIIIIIIYNYHNNNNIIYYQDKDSLDLWLAIEWDCHYDDDVIGDGNGPDDMVSFILLLLS